MPKVVRETLISVRDLVIAWGPFFVLDIAFVQGGASETIRTREEEQIEPVVSLGSLFFEPVWIFYRDDAIKKFGALTQLRGKRVNIGLRGSGSPGLAMRLLGANQIGREEIQRTSVADQEAVIG